MDLTAKQYGQLRTIKDKALAIRGSLEMLRKVAEEATDEADVINSEILNDDSGDGEDQEVADLCTQLEELVSALVSCNDELNGVESKFDDIEAPEGVVVQRAPTRADAQRGLPRPEQVSEEDDGPPPIDWDDIGFRM